MHNQEDSFNKKQEDMSFNETVLSCFDSKEEMCLTVLRVLKEKAYIAALKNSKKPSGYVYFLYDRGLCKIGQTTNHPKVRMKTLAIGNPHIKGIGYFKTSDPKLAEAQLHEKYQARRKAGEWFKLAESTARALIKKHDGDFF